MSEPLLSLGHTPSASTQNERRFGQLVDFQPVTDRGGLGSCVGVIGDLFLSVMSLKLKMRNRHNGSVSFRVVRRSALGFGTKPL